MSGAQHGGGGSDTDPHAVVIGGGIAGLTVAAALAAHGDRVTIVERDPLPTGQAHRKGVPQDRHLHLLLPAGARALETLFPGIIDEMVAAGASTGDTDRIRISLNGHRLARARTGHRSVFASRTFLEAQLRGRVRAHPACTVLDSRPVRGVTATADGRRVTGVQLAAGEDRHEQVLSADLVVDCSGRASRTPVWLTELGYRAPAVDEVEVDVAYATRAFALRTDVIGGDQHVLVGPTADEPVGGAMTRIGADRWLVTLFAMGGARPPLDPDAFRRFAARLAIRDIHDAVQAGEPVGPSARYRFVADVRRRYERLDAFPHGLLVAGDAVCGFNPIYGQGMSVAALQAVTLRDLLGGGAVPDARTWFGAIEPTITAAWELATAGDLAVRRVEGRRSWRVRTIDRYIRRLHRAAVHDPVVAARFLRVAGLIDPPHALLRPGTVVRAVGGRRRRSTRLSGA